MKGEEEGITKMTEILFQAITIHRLYIEKSEKTTNYSIEWKQPLS